VLLSILAGPTLAAERCGVEAQAVMGTHCSSVSLLYAVAAVMLVPLIMAYHPEHPRRYTFDQALQKSAGEFLQHLTPQDAQRYVAIVGAGPAGLRAAELIVALNRQVPPSEQRKVLLFDRNPVLTGLGAYGIPPVKKQGVLKDGVVKQAQGVMHGLVGKREWQRFPTGQFLQVVDSAHVRFFPNTDIGTDITLEQLERLGIPLVIATGAQTPRLPTDAIGNTVPGRHLKGIVSATSEFFRAIGTQWLMTKKGVQGLRYDGKSSDVQGHKAIMIYGGGNVASDAFMWAFRNTAPEVDVLLVYRGELHCMTNMSRPYYKPIDAALLQRRAPTPVFTPADILDLPALHATLKEAQRPVDQLLCEALQVSPVHLAALSREALVAALNTVLHIPDLAKRLAHIEPGSFRLDLHAMHAALTNGDDVTRLDPTQRLTLARTLLEMEYPQAIRRLHRANMLGLLTVEAYLDTVGYGHVTHVRLRQHRRGELARDRQTGAPMLLRSNVIERDNIMRHRYTKEKLWRYNTVATDTYLELPVDCVIEAIGDVVQPVGDLEITSWQSLKADLDTGRVSGRQIWIAGQALTQKGKIRDSYVSALHTVVDMGPWLYPQSWAARHLLRTLVHEA
jgi:NADPH-dependent glutamate synthase beta subunit-like oxidoreductase